MTQFVVNFPDGWRCSRRKSEKGACSECIPGLRGDDCRVFVHQQLRDEAGRRNLNIEQELVQTRRLATVWLAERGCGGRGRYSSAISFDVTDTFVCLGAVLLTNALEFQKFLQQSFPQLETVVLGGAPSQDIDAICVCTPVTGGTSKRT